MPSKSPEQHKLMEIAAHTPGGYGGVPQAVGKEFVKADDAEDLDDTGTAREFDVNDFMTVKENPILREGVFQYKGSQIRGADPDKIYNVYRPLEELEKPETLKSIVGLPIYDDHEMVGGNYPRGAEERMSHGSILESIAIKGKDVVANIRIWSRTLKRLIDSGKTALSLGYKTEWEKSAGVFEGIRYDYIQRNIRGNHLALVNHGRNGTAVLDQSDVFDHFDLALDNMESDMADEKKEEKMEKKAEAKDGTAGTEISLDDVHGWAKKNMPKYKELVDMMAVEEEGDEVALDGDTKEKEGDQALDEDKKEEKKDKAEDNYDKKDAMDAADVKNLITRSIDQFAKTSVKSIMGQVTERDKLAKELEPLIGTFDFAAMDSDDVAVYGAKKLELNAAKGQERAVLTGYLAGIKKSGDKQIGFAMDSAIPKPKSDGLLAKRINNAA